MSFLSFFLFLLVFIFSTVVFLFFFGSLMVFVVLGTYRSDGGGFGVSKWVVACVRGFVGGRC